MYMKMHFDVILSSLSLICTPESTSILYIFIAFCVGCDSGLQCVSTPLYRCTYTWCCCCLCVMRGVCYGEGCASVCVWCDCDSWLLSFLCLFVSTYGRSSFLIIFLVPTEGAGVSMGKRLAANEPGEAWSRDSPPLGSVKAHVMVAEERRRKWEHGEEQDAGEIKSKIMFYTFVWKGKRYRTWAVNVVHK